MGSGVNMSLNFVSNLDYTETSGTKAYNTARKHTTKFYFKPDIELGMSYFIVPAKFRFNMGAALTIPELGWDFVRDEVRNGATGAVNSSSGNVAWKFDSDTGHVKLSSGFTWHFSKNVTADVYWNLLGNVFDAFGSKLPEGSGTSILNTMNLLLIHNFGVLIAVKF